MRNLEVKCPYPDHKRAEACAKEVGASYHGELLQTDTYFHTRRYRLKLRHDILQPAGQGPPRESFELIAYDRPDLPSARTSHYFRLPLPEGRKWLTLFSQTFGVRVRVQKIRRVFLKDNLRIHLDTVRGLGKFLEFELIVSPSHPMSRCKNDMKRLMALFRIPQEELIRYSYSDLALKDSPQRSKKR
jgi:predicted adenylyl cyclase CyaB